MVPHALLSKGSAHVCRVISSMEAFPDGSGPVCRWRQLFPALNNLRSLPHIQSNKKVRVSLDQALKEGGVTSARDEPARGLNVSNRRWAEGQGDVQVKPPGRPQQG